MRAGAGHAARAFAAPAFVVLATGLQLLRQEGTSPWESVWAEDFAVFYVEASELPLWETLLRPYAGYAHAAPRILAAIGVELPVSWYAAWAALSSAIVVSLLALFVYHASAPLLRAPLRQGVLAGATFLLPLLGWEVTGSICNIQWFVALPCLLALLFPVDRAGGIVVRSLIVVLGPLSAPLTVLLFPVALWSIGAGLWRRRSGLGWPGRRFVVPGLYLVACAVQALTYLGASPGQPAGDGLPVPTNLVRLYLTRVVTDLVAGVEVTDRLWPVWGYALSAVAAALLAVLLVVKLWRAGLRARRWIVGFVVASGVSFAAQLLPRWSSLDVDFVPGELYGYAGTRWAVLPTLFLVLALLVPPDLPDGVLLGGAGPGAVLAPEGRGGATTWLSGRQPWVGVCIVILVWCVVVVVPSYRVTNFRSGDEPWEAKVERADLACDVEPDASVTLRVAPGWQVAIVCEQLR